MNEGGTAGPARTPLGYLAFAISAVTSPYVVTGAVATVTVLLLHPSRQELWLWGGICVLTGAVLPLAIVLLMWRKRHLTDIHVAVRSQRALPFVAALVSGAVGVGLLAAVEAPDPLIALGAVYLANGLLLAIISRRWKISVHVSVYSTGVIAVALLGPTEALLGLALVPLVLWARVYRGKHTLRQGLVPVLMSAAVTPAVYAAAVAVLANG